MVLFSKVMNCLESMLPIEIGIAPTTIKPTSDSDNGNGDTTTSTTTTTTTTTTTQASAGCVGPYENIKWKSGSIKNSEWQDGSGYKFNRHIYIPLNGRTVADWEILLEFTDPVYDLEVWVVKADKIDQDGRLWKFKSLDGQPKSVTEDPWVFNFLGKSVRPGSDLEVMFCVFDQPITIATVPTT